MAETGPRTEEEKDAVFNLGTRRLNVAGEYFLDRLWNGRGQEPVRFHVAPSGGRFGHKMRNNLLRHVKLFK